MKKVFLIGISVYALISCKHEPILTPVDEEQVQNIEDDCDEDVVYFEEQILPILQGCATTDCHDATTAEDGVILDSYDNIIETGDIEPGDPENSDIYEMITEDDPDDRMPPEPADPLSDETIQLIYDWITQGAQDNSCPDLICDTVDVTFSGDIQPLVQTFCAACHSGIAPYGGIVIEDYDNISTVASDPNFIGLIDGDFALVMPENTDGLNDCQVRMFEIWIEDGMPNN